MGFRFAEQFGKDHESQRAEIARLARAGQLRKDALFKARAMQMLVIQPNGKPRAGEPDRIARELNQKIKRVRRWIEDVAAQVDWLVSHARISRSQAWVQLKGVWRPDSNAPWVAVERGIERSERGSHAGSRPRRRSGW